MSEKTNGGPAFPRVCNFTHPIKKKIDYENEPGMSLRMYIAVHAMQGLIAGGYATEELIPERAYRIADAMLREGE